MHILLHFLIPAIVAILFFPKAKYSAYAIMLAAMLIDVDHLLATPIYDPERCSIGFHPLHTVIPIIFYGILCCFKKSRLIGLGLIIHIILDAIDCQITNGILWV